MVTRKLQDAEVSRVAAQVGGAQARMLPGLRKRLRQRFLCFVMSLVRCSFRRQPRVAYLLILTRLQLHLKMHLRPPRTEIPTLAQRLAHLIRPVHLVLADLTLTRRLFHALFLCRGRVWCSLSEASHSRDGLLKVAWKKVDGLAGQERV